MVTAGSGHETKRATKAVRSQGVSHVVGQPVPRGAAALVGEMRQRIGTPCKVKLDYLLNELWRGKEKGGGRRAGRRAERDREREGKGRRERGRRSACLSGGLGWVKGEGCVCGADGGKGWAGLVS